MLHEEDLSRPSPPSAWSDGPIRAGSLSLIFWCLQPGDYIMLILPFWSFIPSWADVWIGSGGRMRQSVPHRKKHTRRDQPSEDVFKAGIYRPCKNRIRMYLTIRTWNLPNSRIHRFQTDDESKTQSNEYTTLIHHSGECLLRYLNTWHSQITHTKIPVYSRHVPRNTKYFGFTTKKSPTPPFCA